MRRFFPQTMLGRTLVIIVGCILLLQIVAGLFHYREWREFSEKAERTKIIERVATYVQWMNAATPRQREFLLRSNRFPGMRAIQTKRSIVDKSDDWFGVEIFVRDRLAKALGDIDEDRIRVEDYPRAVKFKFKHFEEDDDDDDHHREENWTGKKRHMFAKFNRPSIFVSVRLDDGVWLNMRVPVDPFKPPRFLGFLMPLLMITVIVVIVAMIIVSRANKPLSRMAKAAEQLGRDVNAPPMSEEGPREVREAARAFNVMQNNLRRFVQDRTHMLAAISHDLRTPITRMKLRAEFVEDDQQREKMLADLDEMEAMIKATMSFARDDVANETVGPLDLAALVETACEDAREMGGDVTYQGPDVLEFQGRQVGLKRAVNNLIGNALKYGSRCDVTLTASDNEVVIKFIDNGPGIPVEELEEVFRPFRRVEASRNKETGGVGLGLAVVRSVAHAHGGTITLVNGSEQGLEAKLTMPL